jgi:hypothetical protein
MDRDTPDPSSIAAGTEKNPVIQAKRFDFQRVRRLAGVADRRLHFRPHARRIKPKFISSLGYASRQELYSSAAGQTASRRLRAALNESLFMESPDKEHDPMAATTLIQDVDLDFNNGVFDSAAFAAATLANWQALASVIDHTLLKPDATRPQVENLSARRPRATVSPARW